MALSLATPIHGIGADTTHALNLYYESLISLVVVFIADVDTKYNVM